METNSSMETNTSNLQESVTLLPRSAWNSQLTKLRLTLKIKQLLDQQEEIFRVNQQ